jgi:hypothetical protein
VIPNRPRGTGRIGDLEAFRPLCEGIEVGDFFEDVYRPLWVRAQAAGVGVRYWWAPLLAGYYDPESNVISLVRAPPPERREVPTPYRRDDQRLSDDELVHEVCTLAHELGHYRSASGASSPIDLAVYRAAVKRFDKVREDSRQRLFEEVTDRRVGDAELADAAIAAVRTELSMRERDAIYAEESLAWVIARRELEAVGFTAWDVLTERTRGALSEYRRLLSVDS